eukprot:5311643-Prymnesium_polylepis.1
MSSGFVAPFIHPQPRWNDQRAPQITQRATSSHQFRSVGRPLGRSRQIGKSRLRYHLAAQKRAMMPPNLGQGYQYHLAEAVR